MQGKSLIVTLGFADNKSGYLVKSAVDLNKITKAFQASAWKA
jgi:hypothetical protein